MYELYIKKGKGFKIIFEDKVNNDIESDKNTWNAKVVFCGNDEKPPFNADVCNIVKELS